MAWIRALSDAVFAALCKLSYAFDGDGPHAMTEVEGARFRTRVGTSDRLVVWEVFRQRAYTDAEAFRIEPSDTVVDVGGHIGAFTVFAARRGAEVYAYEPLEENYELLEENVELNELEDVETVHAAVSDEEGEADLYVGEANLGTTSLYEKEDPGGKTRTRTTTLARIVEEHDLRGIDLLKIDTEGSEYDILLDAPEEVLDRVDRIVLEFHDAEDHGHEHEELVAHLEDHGFDVQVDAGLVKRLLQMGTIRAHRG